MSTTLIKESTFRFSGHETFPCRYAWLSKVVRGLGMHEDLFSNEDDAMDHFGVGKNMVRSMKFWADLAGVIELNQEGGYELSDFGRNVFGHDGYDEYLQDPSTLWLIHWNLSTNNRQPFYFWHFLFNLWHRHEFSQNEVIEVLQFEVGRIASRKLAESTFKSGFRVFINTYFPTRGKKGEIGEDNLDCPLVELELIKKVGERTVADASRREDVYSFNVDSKPSISSDLFIYCLNDFWNKERPNEQTLTLRDVSFAPGSPGQIFKLSEASIRDRLERLAATSSGRFDYQEFANIQQITRKENDAAPILLDEVYINND
jgi:hypothetical protein